MKATIASLTLVIAFCGLAIAQDAPPQPDKSPDRHMGPPMAWQHGGRRPGMGHRGPGNRMFMAKWWKNSELMQKLGVSDEQVQRIEKIFQSHRLDLIDLHAALEKQEVMLEPLIEGDQPDESQVVAQIDKVAQARANLEKSNARMLLAIRRVLTVEQWKKLREQHGMGSFHAGPRFGPPAAPPPGGGKSMYFTDPSELP